MQETITLFACHIVLNTRGGVSLHRPLATAGHVGTECNTLLHSICTGVVMVVVAVVAAVVVVVVVLVVWQYTAAGRLLLCALVLR